MAKNIAFQRLHLRTLFSMTGVIMFAFTLIGPRAVLAAPVISNVSVGQITSTSVVLSWTTDVAADSYVSYGPSHGGSGAALTSDDTLVTHHQVTLSSLQPATQYVYTINSANEDGENSVYDDGTFTTSASATPPPPAPTPTPSPTPTPTPTPPPAAVPTGLQYQAPTSTQTAQTSPYPTGTLAKETGSPAIYFLMGKDRVKIPFTTMAAFTGLGYSLSNVKTLDLSAFRTSTGYFLSSGTQEHPWGSIVKHSNGTLYYSHSSGMIGIPSMEVFYANGFQLWMIVPMNAADMSALQQSPWQVLEANDGRLL